MNSIKNTIKNRTVIVTTGAMVINVGRSLELSQMPGREGDGAVSSQVRDLPPFDAIELRSCVDVEISFGSQQRVEIVADSNLHELIETHVHGLSLIIDINSSLSTRNPIRALVQLPTPLQEVVIEGSGDVTVDALKQDAISLHIRGSGDIRANGTVKRLKARVQGSGDMKLRRLECASADLSIQGSGDIASNVTEEVWASVIGSGDITIHGDPPRRNTKVIGSGDIEFD